MKLIKELTQLAEAAPLRRGWYIVTVAKDTVVAGPFENRAQAEQELASNDASYANKRVYTVKYVDKVAEAKVHPRLSIINAALADMVEEDGEELSLAELERKLQAVAKKHGLTPAEVNEVRDACADAIGGPFEDYPVKEERDPYAWMQKAVDKILDAGDREELLSKPMRELIYIVQRAEGAGRLEYAPTQRLQPFIQAWREKRGVKEGRFDDALNGWYIVNKKTEQVLPTKFKTQDDAQKHLMTKMFANHQNFTVKMFESVAAATFTLQQRERGKKWEDLSTEKFTGKEAQEFLDADPEPERDVEFRAISIDAETVLKPTPKRRPRGKDVLARDASPEVHKRNREFFDKHL